MRTAGAWGVPRNFAITRLIRARSSRPRKRRRRRTLIPRAARRAFQGRSVRRKGRSGRAGQAKFLPLWSFPFPNLPPNLAWRFAVPPIRGLDFAHQFTQGARIFLPRPRLHAAGHVDAKGLRFGNGLRDIVRTQAARHDYGSITLRFACELPITRTPRAAIKATAIAIEQERGSGFVFRQRRQLEPRSRSKRLYHTKAAGQILGCGGLLIAVKLNAIKAQRAGQGRDYVRRPVHEYPNRRYQRRQLPHNFPSGSGA